MGMKCNSFIVGIREHFSFRLCVWLSFSLSSFSSPSSCFLLRSIKRSNLEFFPSRTGLEPVSLRTEFRFSGAVEEEEEEKQERNGRKRGKEFESRIRCAGQVWHGDKEVGWQ